MVHAKNYGTTCTFVEIVQKKLWPLFSGHGVDTPSIAAPSCIVSIVHKYKQKHTKQKTYKTFKN